jgi:hypothetical protein
LFLYTALYQFFISRVSPSFFCSLHQVSSFQPIVLACKPNIILPSFAFEHTRQSELQLDWKEELKHIRLWLE